MIGDVYVTEHATQRWRERVDPGTNRTTATIAIVRLWRGGVALDDANLPAWLRVSRIVNEVTMDVMDVEQNPDAALVVRAEPDPDSGIYHVLTVLTRDGAHSIRRRQVAARTTIDHAVGRRGKGLSRRRYLAELAEREADDDER